MDYFSLLLPIAYLIVLIGSLAIFSTLYRRRQAAATLSLEPWFPQHLPRNIYLSLLELQTTQKIPDTILRAALLRRAVEDIHRLMQLRSQKPALLQLLQRGSVGDDLFKRFQAAEKEMELELKDVQAEANALAPLPSGANPATAWGNTIFQSASEMAHREIVTRKLTGIEEGRHEAKSEWEGRRKRISEKFLGELEGAGEGGAKKELPDTRIAKEGAAMAREVAPEALKPQTPVKEERKAASSDEDTVLVEGGGPDSSTAGLETPGSEVGTPGGGGSKRKKKGKK